MRKKDLKHRITQKALKAQKKEFGIRKKDLKHGITQKTRKAQKKEFGTRKKDLKHRIAQKTRKAQKKDLECGRARKARKALKNNYMRLVILSSAGTLLHKINK